MSSPSTNSPNPDGGPWSWPGISRNLPSLPLEVLRVEGSPPPSLCAPGTGLSFHTLPACFPCSLKYLPPFNSAWRIKETYHTWELIHFSSKWWKKKEGTCLPTRWTLKDKTVPHRIHEFNVDLIIDDFHQYCCRLSHWLSKYRVSGFFRFLRRIKEPKELLFM